MDCLKACQEQLRVAKARSKAAGCAERMFLIALRRENGQRKPLKSVENVVRGIVLQVLGSMDSVEEACRKAGVCVESHDRMQLFLNAFIRGWPWCRLPSFCLQHSDQDESVPWRREIAETLSASAAVSSAR